MVTFKVRMHILIPNTSQLKREERQIIAHIHTCSPLQKSGSVNQVSSTTTSGVLGFLLYATAAIEDVTTTLFTDEAFAHEPRTLSVPFTAGSINSAWNKGNSNSLNIQPCLFQSQEEDTKLPLQHYSLKNSERNHHSGLVIEQNYY